MSEDEASNILDQILEKQIKFKQDLTQKVTNDKFEFTTIKCNGKVSDPPADDDVVGEIDELENIFETGLTEISGILNKQNSQMQITNCVQVNK